MAFGDYGIYIDYIKKDIEVIMWIQAGYRFTPTHPIGRWGMFIIYKTRLHTTGGNKL